MSLSTKTKICILTTVHHRTDTRIFYKEAKSLANAGYDVTIIAQHDRDDIVDGIKIVALPKPSSRIQRMTRIAWQAYRIAININADIYHFHDPELIPVGLLLKMNGKRVIYDVHEDVPLQSLSKHYMPKYIRKPIAWGISVLEWIGTIFFDAIVAATPQIAERFPSIKTVTIQNFPISDELVNTESTKYKTRPASFAYIGVIASIRGAEEMVRAFEFLHDMPNVHLHLAGNFSPEILSSKLQTLNGWESIVYHGFASRKQVAEILSNVRAGLVTLHPTLNYLDSYPVKMFEYMAVGLPIIASDFPLWRCIVDNAKCGLLVDPKNPKEIADSMRWILNHPIEAYTMGQRGRQAVEQIYNWDAEAVKLINLYKFKNL